MWCALSNRDVVRHKLVKEIIKAFERYERQAEQHAKNQKINGSIGRLFWEPAFFFAVG